MNFTLPRLFRNPAISNFFPFPLGLRNSGVRLHLGKNGDIENFAAKKVLKSCFSRRLLQC